MKKRQLSIVFDNESVRFVEAGIKGEVIKTVYNSFTLNSSTLIQDGLLNRNEWSNLLKEAMQKRLIKAKIVHVIIPTSVVILRQQTLPDLPLEELKLVIQNEIGNTIHFPFNNPVFDVVKLDSENSSNESEEIPTVQSVIVAAPGTVINNIVDVLREYRFKVQSVDIPALSYYRYAKIFYPGIKKETKIYCYIMNNGIDIHIIDKGILSFTRYVPNNMQNYIKENDGYLDEKAFASDLAYEIERAKNYYQYTLNNRDKQLAGVIISSEREITDIFIDTLRKMVGLEITLLDNVNKTLPRKLKQLKGNEIGIGALLRKVKK